MAFEMSRKFKFRPSPLGYYTLDFYILHSAYVYIL